MRLLILEDDPGIRGPLAASLRENGFATDEAARTYEAEGMVQAYPYDALIVDVRLPDGENAGFEFVQNLRARGNQTPVLFLTARDTMDDRITGMDAGGGAYLIKPFQIAEVRAWLHALLRRSVPTRSVPLERGRLRIDWNARAVSIDGRNVHLTAKEYGILELLASHPGHLFNREEIIERVWDANFNAESNIIEVYVKNIRRKLGEKTIDNLKGFGYRFPAETTRPTESVQPT
jgi:DNA-binding response OmpR family regulator